MWIAIKSWLQMIKLDEAEEKTGTVLIICRGKEYCGEVDNQHIFTKLIIKYLRL